MSDHGSEALPESLIGALRQAGEAAREALQGALDAESPGDAVESVRLAYLGKKGEVSKILKSMGKLEATERPRVGKVANEVRDAIEAGLTEAKAEAESRALARELEGPALDVTRPGRPVVLGRRHPVSQTLDDMLEVLGRLGFDVASGPEIEGDFYNFEALGIPPSHPARDMQDTFYLGDAVRPGHAKGREGSTPPAPGHALLRTHTSPVQIRTMLGQNPPVRVVCPGKVYRRDSDVTHTPMFHQVEGLWVDKGITMAHLKGILEAFAEAFFGPGTRIRLRPSYFGFTEPSAEVDVTCTLCGGDGCRVCSQTGWLEVLGAGMVDPVVFEHVGYDPEVYTGFAFGMGVDRLAMLRYRIEDLRTLFDNDVRFLTQ